MPASRFTPLGVILIAMVSPDPSAIARPSPFIVAHRGASAEAPENTLPAFELAWNQGADAIEGDFHLTKDGHIVAIHDGDTKKRAGVKRVVSKTTLADLRKLDVGAWKGPRFVGTRIPLLTEVLATVPEGRKIYIEVKCGVEILAPLVAALEKSNLQDHQTVIISFHADVVSAIKKAAPQYTANLLVAFGNRLGQRPGERWPDLLAALRQIKADGVSTNPHPSITPTLITTLLDAGYHHHVWTVNDAPIARRFLDMGTASITTDVPGELRAGLFGR